jgi:hypothetical protein
MNETNRTLPTEGLADWDLCDEHETTFPKGDACPKCIEDYEPPEPDGECYCGTEAAGALAESQAWIQRNLK